MCLVASAVGKDNNVTVVQVPAGKAEGRKGLPHLRLLWQILFNLHLKFQLPDFFVVKKIREKWWQHENGR